MGKEKNRMSGVYFLPNLKNFASLHIKFTRATVEDIEANTDGRLISGCHDGAVRWILAHSFAATQHIKEIAITGEVRAATVDWAEDELATHKTRLARRKAAVAAGKLVTGSPVMWLPGAYDHFDPHFADLLL
jgi:hypothetical protein